MKLGYYINREQRQKYFDLLDDIINEFHCIYYILVKTFDYIYKAIKKHFLFQFIILIFRKILNITDYLFFTETGSYVNNEGSGLYALQSACEYT